MAVSSYADCCSSRGVFIVTTVMIVDRLCYAMQCIQAISDAFRTPPVLVLTIPEPHRRWELTQERFDKRRCLRYDSV